MDEDYKDNVRKAIELGDLNNKNLDNAIRRIQELIDGNQ